MSGVANPQKDGTPHNFMLTDHDRDNRASPCPGPAARDSPLHAIAHITYTFSHRALLFMCIF